MTLTEIEYGSIASSSVMNNNFNHLNSRITQINESITTSISSIVSNIATINSALEDLASDLDDAETELNSKIEVYRAKTKLLVAKASVLPNWAACTEVTLPLDGAYTVQSNGYLIVVPDAESTGNITINEKSISCPQTAVILPVAKGDAFFAGITLSKLYMLPLKEVSIEGF